MAKWGIHILLSSMVPNGSFNSLEFHGKSKCASLHQSALWNTISIHESVF